MHVKLPRPRCPRDGHCVGCRCVVRHERVHLQALAGKACARGNDVQQRRIAYRWYERDRKLAQRAAVPDDPARDAIAATVEVTPCVPAFKGSVYRAPCGRGARAEVHRAKKVVAGMARYAFACLCF